MDIEYALQILVQNGLVADIFISQVTGSLGINGGIIQQETPQEIKQVVDVKVYENPFWIFPRQNYWHFSTLLWLDERLEIDFESLEQVVRFTCDIYSPDLQFTSNDTDKVMDGLKKCNLSVTLKNKYYAGTMIIDNLQWKFSITMKGNIYLGLVNHPLKNLASTVCICSREIEQVPRALCQFSKNGLYPDSRSIFM